MSGREGSPHPARRMLAVLECRSSDDDVRLRAVELASRLGRVPDARRARSAARSPASPRTRTAPRASRREELRAHAASALARAVALVPSDVPLMTALEEGRPVDVIRRRVQTAAHDAVVVRRRRRLRGRCPCPSWRAEDPNEDLDPEETRCSKSHVIQTKGFKNVGEGDASGFQVAVRCPYYRGIWASLIEGAELTVDGETFGSDGVELDARSARRSLHCELAESDRRCAGRSRSRRSSPSTSRAVSSPASTTSSVSVTWRWSYIPVEMQPTTNISSRKLVLVR